MKFLKIDFALKWIITMLYPEFTYNEWNNESDFHHRNVGWWSLWIDEKWKWLLITNHYLLCIYNDDADDDETWIITIDEKTF